MPEPSEGGVLVAERRTRLLEEVRARGAVSAADLAAALHVSVMTVRRDIDLLAERGELVKVRGGATAVRHPGTGDGDFASRLREARPEKVAIARLGASMIEPGMAIAVSGGTTAFLLARLARDIPRLTVVTNSLRVADLFDGRGSGPTSSDVVLTGGVRTSAGVLAGPVAVRTLAHLHCDLTFVSARGVHAEAGLTVQNPLEAETNRALAAAGSRVVALADHRKWGAVGLATFLDLGEVDVFVTDAGLAEPGRRRLAPLVRQLRIAPLAA